LLKLLRAPEHKHVFPYKAVELRGHDLKCQMFLLTAMPTQNQDLCLPRLA